MKLQLLSLAVAMASFTAGAETTLNYGLCGDSFTGIGTGMGGSNYSAAIEVPEAVAKALEGNKVTDVDIAFYSGVSKIINVYLTYDLDAEPFYTQESRVKVQSYNNTALETPYVIEGRKFYIGYTYRQSSSTGKPIAFSGEDIGGMDAFSHLAVWTDGGVPEWINAAKYGALGIRAKITGDKTLENCAIPVGLRLPKSSPTNKEFTYEVDLLNFSSNSLTSFEAVSDFQTGSLLTTGEDFAKSLAPGQRTTITLSATTNKENPELKANISISKVNGADNLWAACPATGTMISSDFVFPRVIVIEEATGTGCGYCPAGYVAMEQMRKNHKDDYIGIAVHNYSGDPMRCASYDAWEGIHINGYPQATINRAATPGTFSPQPTACEAWYKELSGVLNLRFEMQAEYTDDSHSAVRVATYFAPGTDLDSHTYGVALVETEDNVGPYNQYNGYSGGQYGEMGGFESLPSWVSLTYNDVARAIYNWSGKTDAFPKKMTARKRYTYNEEIPVVTSPSKQKDMQLIALLIDRSTGEIVTATKCVPDRIFDPEWPETKPEDPNSVEEADLSSVSVRALSGAIAIDGTFDKAQIFTLDGTNVASIDAPATLSVAPGLHIVRVITGSKTESFKIIIK